MNNNDMINLLRLVEGQQFAGEPEQKPGDQVRGTDKAVVKGRQHPFHDRLVGEDTTLEDVLSKKYADFKDVQAKEKAEKKKEEKEDVSEAGGLDSYRQRVHGQGFTDSPEERNADRLDRKRRHQDSLNRISDIGGGSSDEERAHQAQQRMARDEYKLDRLKRNDDDWDKTFDMMRDRLNRYQWSSQRDVDPEQLAAISNIKYEPRKKTEEDVQAKTDDKLLAYYAKRKAEKEKQKQQQDVAEDSPRVDSLVTDALKIMRGPELTDAVQALKTVLGDREFSGRRSHYNFFIRQMMDMYRQRGVTESEGEPEGVPHITKELLQHIVQQVGKEGAHAIVKSLTWGDGAAKELLHLIVDDLKDDIKQDFNEAANPADKVTMDVPLLIRIMEYAREDAQTDMDLHDVTERLIKLSDTGNTLSMEDYDSIVGMQAEQQVNELGATPIAPPQGTATTQPTAQPGAVKTADGSISPDEQIALNKINQNPAMKQQLDKLMTQATPGGASAPVKLDPDEQDALNKIKSNAGLGTQYAKLIKQANPASTMPATTP